MNGILPFGFIIILHYEINRIMIRIKSTKPTDSELEILAILWDKKQATVRAVHEELSKTKDAGYTTTLKLMQIMFDKKLVYRDESNKTHIYSPAVTREKTQTQFLNRMIDNLFAGSPTELVLQALGQSTTSEADLDKIQQMIESLKNKK